MKKNTHKRFRCPKCGNMKSKDDLQTRKTYKGECVCRSCVKEAIVQDAKKLLKIVNRTKNLLDTIVEEGSSQTQMIEV